MKVFVAIILLGILVITGCEQGDTRKNKTQSNELLNQFYGIWTNKDDQSYILELQDGVELVGLKEGDIISSSKITIEEVNVNEHFIIIQGTTKYYDDDSEKEKFKSKLILRDDGKELLYLNDFLGEKFESQWIR